MPFFIQIKFGRPARLLSAGSLTELSNGNEFCHVFILLDYNYFAMVSPTHSEMLLITYLNGKVIGQVLIVEWRWGLSQSLRTNLKVGQLIALMYSHMFA